jgi:hypothetical protein
MRVFQFYPHLNILKGYKIILQTANVLGCQRSNGLWNTSLNQLQPNLLHKGFMINRLLHKGFMINRLLHKGFMTPHPLSRMLPWIQTQIQVSPNTPFLFFLLIPLLPLKKGKVNFQYSVLEEASN